VGRILRESGVPVLEFRASVVIGSGSLSFEMIRSLVGAAPDHDHAQVGEGNGAARAGKWLIFRRGGKDPLRACSRPAVADLVPDRRFQFEKRSQLFIRMHNETLSVIAVRVCNKDCSPVAIHR
jgi:hypothetical protein